MQVPGSRAAAGKLLLGAGSWLWLEDAAVKNEAPDVGRGRRLLEAVAKLSDDGAMPRRP